MKLLQTPKATSDSTFFESWIQQHKVIAAAMNKPLVLEELGKQVQNNISTNTLESDVLTVRQPFMEMVYSAFNQSLIAGDVWRGNLPAKIGHKQAELQSLYTP